jgi:hypothetical protein
VLSLAREIFPLKIPQRFKLSFVNRVGRVSVTGKIAGRKMNFFEILSLAGARLATFNPIDNNRLPAVQAAKRLRAATVL